MSTPHSTRWAVAALLGAAVLLVVLSGCATMRAYQAETDKWQSLANDATTQLHTSPVTVHVTPGYGGKYWCAERRVDLGTDQAEWGARWVLAHELGHHLYGHCQEGIFAYEVQADLAAIRVYEIWGLTESQAAKEVATRLWWIAKKGYATALPGHDTCAELVAVLRAYPILTNPTDGTCSAELAR